MAQSAPSLSITSLLSASLSLQPPQSCNSSRSISHILWGKASREQIRDEVMLVVPHPRALACGLQGIIPTAVLSSIGLEIANTALECKNRIHMHRH